MQQLRSLQRRQRGLVLRNGVEASTYRTKRAVRRVSEPPVFTGNGTEFPNRGSTGKRVPLWRRIPGCSFRFDGHWETASRSEVGFRDALSARGRCGNCVPLRGPNLGRAVRNGAHGESASHFGTVARLVRLPRQPRQRKNRLEREFQPAANARLCLAVYDCAPSRKKRRLK